jgi:hypothetical protein
VASFSSPGENVEIHKTLPRSSFGNPGSGQKWNFGPKCHLFLARTVAIPNPQDVLKLNIVCRHEPVPSSKFELGFGSRAALLAAWHAWKAPGLHATPANPAKRGNPPCISRLLGAATPINPAMPTNACMSPAKMRAIGVTEQKVGDFMLTPVKPWRPFQQSAGFVA